MKKNTFSRDAHNTCGASIILCTRLKKQVNNLGMCQNYCGWLARLDSDSLFTVVLLSIVVVVVFKFQDLL